SPPDLAVLPPPDLAGADLSNGVGRLDLGPAYGLSGGACNYGGGVPAGAGALWLLFGSFLLLLFRSRRRLAMIAILVAAGARVHAGIEADAFHPTDTGNGYFGVDG